MDFLGLRVSRFPKHTSSMENCVSSKRLFVGNLSGPQDAYTITLEIEQSVLQGPLLQGSKTHIESNTLVSETA